MIGSLEKTVVECPDPRALAASCCAVLGMRVTEDSDDRVVIGSAPARRDLAFQRTADWAPPTWPDPHGSQQMHLDVRVDDPDRRPAEPLLR